MAGTRLAVPLDRVRTTGLTWCGRPAIAGQIPAGLFPRDMTAAPNGTVLVSSISSGQVEAVDTATIP
jgi:hypothetical protein